MTIPFTREKLGLDNWIAHAAIQQTPHAHFVAADVPAAAQRILEVSQGRCRFSVSESGPFLQFREAHAYAGELAVKFFSWNCFGKCETSVDRSPGHQINLHIPLQGSFEALQGSQTVTVAPGQMLVVSSPGVVRRRWEGPCDLLNVAISRKLAVSVFSHLADASGLLSLPLVSLDLARHATLARMIEMMVQDLGREHPSLSSPDAIPHTERLLLTLLAEALRGSPIVPQQRESVTIAPYYVRRAEEYLRDNYARKISMGELAKTCGVSTRTLHYGFAKFRDHSPAERLRAIRLMQARHAIIEARISGHKIAEIAKLVGYDNKSQFSRDYKAHFHESPSETLRAAFI
jgi:AraC-like DNA-binding protein